jgi:hypothetical protein
MDLKVIGMGLKASGASLHVMIANFDVQQCMYLERASARINMKKQMISYTETLIRHPKLLLPFLDFVSIAFLLTCPFEERPVRSLLQERSDAFKNSVKHIKFLSDVWESATHL